MKLIFDLQLFADEEFLKDNLAGFVPVQKVNEIIALTTRGSSILRLSRIEQMDSDTMQIPLMTDGPGAYWVGESERIKTDTAEWIFPQLKAKKIAVIIPVTKEKINENKEGADNA